jgi:ubiquinone/menaquinone biosynthesis C-methylase UbiE
MQTTDTQGLSSSQYASADKLHARWNLYDSAVPKINIHQIGIDRLQLNGNESILEVGYGDGTILTNLRQHGHTGTLVGIEINDSVFREPADTVQTNRIPINFIVGSADNTPFPDESFDLILAYFMLYHMPDIRKTLQEWSRVLKQGGRVLIATSSQSNKPKHKAFKKMAESLIGKTAPPQFSSTFNLENAEQQLNGIFKITDKFIYNGEIRIKTADLYLAAFRSTRDMYEPLPSDEEWNNVERVVRDSIKKEIDENGFFADQVHRGFFVCHKI